MAKAKTPSQKKAYDALNKRLLKYVAMVRAIYDNLNLEASKIASHTPYDAEGEKPFKFKDYPATTDSVKKLQQRFVNDLGTVIMSGTSQEWKNSNELQDLLADKVIKTYGAKRGTTRTKKYYQVNNDALKAFQQRRINGMNLSQNLWNQAENYKQGLEFALSSAIEKGMSAVTLSKRISRYLNDFESLRKDYKERYGKAVDCHDCEYRSIRLARSEINMAYRTAEQTRWQQMDFILGYEIKLSHSHPCHDICDDLKGRYPKSFKWVGWHPNDLCYVVPIIKSEEKWWEDEDYRGNDNDEITDVPQGFKTWVANNQDRISKAEKRGTLPYFVRDNREWVKQAITQGELRRYLEGGKYTTQDNIAGSPTKAYVPKSFNSQEQKAWNKNNAEIERVLNTTAGPPMSYEEANLGKENPKYKEEGGNINCQTCTVVHEMRRRGYDVEALPNDNKRFVKLCKKEKFSWLQRFVNADGTDVDYDFTYGWIKKKGGLMDSKKLGEYVVEKINTDGRYEIYCGWKGSKNTHVFCAERINGEIKWFDPQTGRADVSDYFKKINPRMVGIIRIDDKLINPKMMGMLRIK